MSINPALQALPGFSVITRWSQVIANYNAEKNSMNFTLIQTCMISQFFVFGSLCFLRQRSFQLLSWSWV